MEEKKSELLLHPDLVKQTWRNLEYIPRHRITASMCHEAFEQSPMALALFPDELKDPERCLQAVCYDGQMLQHVPIALRDEKICETALSKTLGAFVYVPDELKTPEMCARVVSRWGFMLEYVPMHMRTAEICLLALLNSTEAEPHIPNDLKHAHSPLETLSVRSDYKAIDDKLNEILRRLEGR